MLTAAGALPAVAQGPKPATATASDADALGAAKEEAKQLTQARKFAEAVAPAERALTLSESIFGPDAPETATAAHNLGFLLRRVNRAEDAKRHLERALAIYQRTLPAVHEDVRNIAGELGNIYLAGGRGGDAVALYERLVAKTEAEGDSRHIGAAHLLANLGFLLSREKREAEARAAWERAVAIYATDPAPEGEAYRLVVDALLDGYWSAGEEDKARALVEATLRRIGEGPQADAAAASRLLIRLGALEHAAGNYTRSRELAERGLKLVDPDGKATGSHVADALNNLARAEKALANFDAAERYYMRALAALDNEKQLALAGILTDNLAVLYSAMRRFADAEKTHKRALQLLESAYGRGHRSVGQCAANLGALLSEQGRLAEAEPFLRRGLEIAEQQKPQDPVLIATISDNLAGVLRQSGRHEEALAQLKKALALFEQSLPADHPSLATVRNNLGRYLIDVRRYEEAEGQLVKALAIGRAALGGDYPSTIVTATNLSELYLETGRKAEARPLIEHAVAALEARFGDKHSSLLIPLVQLGRLELGERRPEKAAAAFQRAVDIELQQRALSGQGAGDKQRGGAEERSAFAGLLEALWQSGEASGVRDVARSLSIGEWETITPATAALAAQAARMGSGDAKLGALVRERQDLAAEWSAKDERLTEILALGSDRDTALEARLRERIRAIEARLAEIDQGLNANYPRHGALARPSPLGIEETRSLIAPEEAALQYVVTRDATYLWAVTRTAQQWVRIPVGESELGKLVRAVRCGLDRAEWARDGGRECNRLLGTDGAETPLETGYALPFNLDRAHGLYKILIEPVRELIAGKELIVVTSGPLSALPFAVLVTATSAAPATGAVPDYAHAAWLARAHAVAVIPSLSSLKALRKFALASKANERFLGFGNPLLTGSDGNDKRAWEKQACGEARPAAAPLVASSSMVEAFSSLFRGGLGNVSMLRRQPPLPETADELCAVARLLGAKTQRVLLGQNASEARVKAMSAAGELAKARVLHFATHGLLAGETAYFVSAGAEPALLLTPPDEATQDDDGLLTASEVAALKLDADWVVLSACNTAAGDRAGSEALSGLARAFLYAGARTLLVSHWAVDSDATVKLVTGGFAALARDRRLGRAEAMRRAMVGLIEKGDQLAHPANWSPFIVVGEGGAPRMALKTPPGKRGTDGSVPALRDLFAN